MTRARGFTVIELVLAAAVLAGVVAMALAWLLAQQRFADATAAHLEDAARHPPLVALLRQDVRAAGQVLPAWQGVASDEHTMILAIPQDADGYRTGQAAVVMYAPAGKRLLRAAFPDREASAAEAASRFVGPDTAPGREVRFAYLDADGNELAGEGVVAARAVVVALPAEQGRRTDELRLALGNTLP